MKRGAKNQMETKTKKSNAKPFRSTCTKYERFNVATLLLGAAIAVIVVNVNHNVLFVSKCEYFNVTGTFVEDKWTDVTNESYDNATYNTLSRNHVVSLNSSYLKGMSQNERPLCRRQQIRTGKWLPLTLEKPPYVSKTMHLRCQLPSYDYTSPGPYPSWIWEQDDSSCQLRAWDADAFCDLLPYTTVSVMGDSLSWEQYSSLIQLLGVRVHQSDQHASRLENRNVVYFACRGKNRGTKFVFRNDAELKAETISNSISSDFPAVIILNRGAHYVNDTELLDDMNELLPVLLNWYRTCSFRYKRCHLFWRTTVPGHPMCGDFTSPVNDLTTMESLVESRGSYTNETTWNYHWQDFKHQNQLVLDLFRQFSATTRLQYEVIDAYDLNILRPDRHRWHQNDCLHSCYPGKMDVYNQLLLHFLSASRSNDDVQYMIDRFERYISNQTVREQKG